MRKKVITRLCDVCVKPRNGTRSCFGPRNSKIVYQNSTLSAIPTFNVIKVNNRIIDMTIEEKYLELRKKSVSRENNRYLFTYLENRPKSRLHRVIKKKKEATKCAEYFTRHFQYGFRYVVHLKQLCMLHKKS